jgi:FkbM family methyltransferase
MTRVVPVVLFAYRRPDLLARTLASLRANRVPLLYAFSDGARDLSVEADVAEVRRLLRAVDWTRVVLVEQPTNVGVGESELSGISRVLAEHEEMISCEDDLEFGPGTYDYLCAALARYRDEARVMGVTAWNHPRVTPPDVLSQPYFSGRMCGLLWGTWRRAWAGVRERTAAELSALCAERGIDITAYGGDLAGAVIHEFEYGMWDLRFNLHMLAERGLMLYPARSMVAHIGYDARATNSPRAGEWVDAPEAAPTVAAIQWPAVVEHPANAALWRLAVNPRPRPGRLVRAARRLGRTAGTVSDLLRRVRAVARRALADLRLEFIRRRVQRTADGDVVHVAGLSFRVTHGGSAYRSYHDALVRRDGAFTSSSDAPVVIDGGASMGMFILATLRDHPAARITAFEPDPAVFPLLRENVDRSGARTVTLVNAALGGADGEITIAPGGRAGDAVAGCGAPVRARVHRLSRYVEHEIDFLRLDIEGEELEVLRELEKSGRLPLVREMAIVYRERTAAGQRLGALLSLLEANGYRYVVRGHDDESRACPKTPAGPAGDTSWSALVRARREGAAPGR